MATLSLDQVQSLTDELGELQAQLAAYDALTERRDTIRRALAEHCDALGDNETTLHGSHYTAVFSKPPLMREIKPEHLGEYLSVVGVDGLLKSCKVSTTSAAKLLSAIDQERLFTCAKGARRLKSVIERQPSTEQAALERFYSELSGLVGARPTGRPTSL
ncbi:hypothetical protein [Methylomonas rhizoryzae]|uniref:hypothetical protein n=1 Tax=Methylomonas rhizoryzae TaxID=2608981 RepID=UPI00123268B9|nr:hypothetical protein [Methylomonas rhizoryzae]